MAKQHLKLADPDPNERIATFLRVHFPTDFSTGELAYSRRFGVWHGAVTFTPEISSRLLADHRPDFQRKIRPDKQSTQKLVRDMAAAEWHLNGEAVVLSESLWIVNGQTRLFASTQADMPFDTMLTVGVADDVFDLYDQHDRRTLGAGLMQRGERDSNALASAIKHLWLYRRGGLYSRVGYPSLREGLELLEQNPNLRRSVTIGRRAQMKRIPGGLLAFLHYAFSEKDPLLADWFFERLATSTDLQPATPILALHGRLNAISTDDIGRTSEQTVARFIVKAWNYTRAGKKLKRLSLKDRENPEIE